MEVLAGLVTEMIKYSVRPLARQIDYLVHYKKNIDDLGKKVVELESTRNDVQRSVDTARRNGESIKEGVHLWLKRVDTVEKEAKRLVLEAAQMRGVVIKKEIDDWLQRVETVGNEVITLQLNAEAENVNGCFKGWRCARYGLGKQAKKKIGIVDQLLNEGKFNSVSDPPPPPTIASMPTGDFQAFESTQSAMKQVIAALKTEMINIVGVYGMGGVGKTTLMKQVAKRVKIDDELFDEVVMVTASQNPNIKKIQGEIAEQLGLKLQEELSEPTRAGRLFERMKQDTRILIILDDLWRRVELADVGIPYGDEHKGCKVVLTTRSEDVCSVMETQAKIAVEVLSEADSWHLFRMKAGDVVDSPNLHKVAREVVEECKGLPVAIVTLGRALRYKAQNIWVDVAQQLRKSIFTSIEGMHPRVFNSIKLSYDCLESEETKKCFLFCCLFPEDYQISMDDLWGYVMGEELLEDVDTLEEARSRLHTVVDKLTASCLLLKSDRDGYVMMHDIVRDVAISIASNEGNGFVVKAGLGLKQWPKGERKKLGQCKRMSLMNNEISELPDQPECPELLTLLLPGNQSLQKIPDRFFEGMKSLATLDLSNTRISSLPPSLSCLANLGTLYLENCGHLKDVSLLGLLKKLEILSLRKCNLIYGLPKEIGELTNLKLLNLSLTLLRTIPPNVISSLSRLEELNMWYCFDRWEIEGMGDESKASLAEVASLTCLTTLYLHVNNVKCLSKDIRNIHWENLTKFRIFIGIGDRYNQYCGEASRSIKLINTSDPDSNWIKFLLKRTEELRLHSFNGLKNVVQFEASGLFNLKYLEVRSCDKMEYLINVVEEFPAETAFRSLEKIELKDMRKLKEICHGPLPAGLLDKLRVINVKNCEKLISILPSYLLLRLQNLEELKVAKCKRLKDVFESEGLEEEHVAISRSVRKMYLDHLPNLKVVRVHNCPKLRYVFPQSVVQRFQKLEVLQVLNCKNMVKIIKSEEEEEEVEVVVEVEEEEEVEVVVEVEEVLHTTTSSTNNILWQSNLCNSSGTLPPPIFPNLRKLRIWGSKCLKYLFPMRVVRGFLQLEIIIVDTCKEMGEIIVDDEAEKGDEEGKDEDKRVLPRLRKLYLSNLPKLSRIYQRGLLFDWPYLDIVGVKDCPSLKKLPLGPQSAPRLREIIGDEIWFLQLDWEDQSVKSRLQLLQRNIESVSDGSDSDVSDVVGVSDITDGSADDSDV